MLDKYSKSRKTAKNMYNKTFRTQVIFTNLKIRIWFRLLVIKRIAFSTQFKPAVGLILYYLKFFKIFLLPLTYISLSNLENQITLLCN